MDIWHQVDGYINDRLLPQDIVLETVLNANQQAGLPAIDVSPSQGQLLHIFARMVGAKRILEIGTLGGYSTIWLARALPDDGHMVTLEIDLLNAETALANFRLAQVDQQIELRLGDALTQLAKMEDEQTAPFDLIFIDADKPNNPHYLKWALHFSHPGTVIIGDNVVREGAVIEENNEDARVVGVRAFYDLIGEEPRLTATAIQTVGCKGYDGFIIGIVNA